MTTGITKPLLVMGEHDRGGIAFELAERLAYPGGAALGTVADVNPLLDSYVEVLKGLFDGDELREMVLDERRQALQSLLLRHSGQHCHYRQLRILEGIPFVEIIKAAGDDAHDLIIKVAEGDDAHSGLLGSTDLHLLRKSATPVLLVDPAGASPFNRVLAAVDVYSAHTAELNRLIVAQAAMVADRCGAELYLLGALHLEDAALQRNKSLAKIGDERLAQYCARLMGEAGEQLQELARHARRVTQLRSKPTTHLLKGPAKQVVPAFVEAQGIDLLTLASVNHTSVPGLFIGETAEAILGRIRCSVLSIKPPGFVSPVLYGTAGTKLRLEAVGSNLRIVR